jgi:hypothetical protein
VIKISTQKKTFTSPDEKGKKEWFMMKISSPKRNVRL